VLLVLSCGFVRISWRLILDRVITREGRVKRAVKGGIYMVLELFHCILRNYILLTFKTHDWPHVSLVCDKIQSTNAIIESSDEDKWKIIHTREKLIIFYP
jgi:hypothetical protein